MNFQFSSIVALAANTKRSAVLFAWHFSAVGRRLSQRYGEFHIFRSFKNTKKIFHRFVRLRKGCIFYPILCH